jgi:hypothetical protein
MQIHTLIPPTSVSPACGGRGRWFGGSKTSARRAKCIAYAWRRHRSSWRTREDRNTDQPFWFQVTGSVFKSTKTGRPMPTIGRGRVIGFVTAADRTRALPFLREMGYNSFTEFRDVNATFALQIGQSPAKTVAPSPAPQPLKTGTIFSNRIR